MHFTAVDTIGMECIASAKLVGSDHTVLPPTRMHRCTPVCALHWAFLHCIGEFLLNFLLHRLKVLVHAKLGLMAGRALELTVRSKELRLTDVVHRQLSELLPK